MDALSKLVTAEVGASLPPIDDAPQGIQPLPAAERVGTALCLSGGGYRAALFHLGALRRLNELGLLSQVDTVSSVSGGSITAGYVAQILGNEWPAPGTVLPNWSTVETAVRKLCRKNIRTLPVLWRLLPWNWTRPEVSVSELIKRYQREGMRLQLSELPAHPRFVFCATDMSYGVNWIFSREEVGSYMAGHLMPAAAARFSLADAVGASSCFPPVFAPLPVGCEPTQYTGGHDNDKDRNRRAARIRGLRLSDGGLYDNMGLEPVWKRHRFLLVSDGGGTFEAEGAGGLFWRLSRYTQLIGRQVGALRKRWLIASYQMSNPENPEATPDQGLAGTYWGIGTPTSSYGGAVPGYSPELVEDVISEIRTDLDSFSNAEIEVLINHGYLLAAAAAERWLRPFGLIAVDAPLATPFERRMDESKVRKWLAGSHRRKLPLGRLH